MEKIEFSRDVKIGDVEISTITVKPLTFVNMVKLWNRSNAVAKPTVQFQRERIKHQTVFADVQDTAHVPDDAQIGQLPIDVAKAIIDALDVGQGKMGSVQGSGDAVGTPVIWKLGTPIEMSGKGEKQTIIELEFHAETFGQVEDILAADGELSQALELIQNLAVPLGVKGLMRLPGWALDSLTTADGVGIMREILPRF